MWRQAWASSPSLFCSWTFLNTISASIAEAAFLVQGAADRGLREEEGKFPLGFLDLSCLCCQSEVSSWPAVSEAVTKSSCHHKSGVGGGKKNYCVFKMERVIRLFGALNYTGTTRYWDNLVVIPNKWTGRSWHVIQYNSHCKNSHHSLLILIQAMWTTYSIWMTSRHQVGGAHLSGNVPYVPHNSTPFTIFP